MLLNPTAKAIGVWFVRGLVALTGANIRCRNCDAWITAWSVPTFVLEGCSNCGSQKLQLAGASIWRTLLIIAAVLALLIGLALLGVGHDYNIYMVATRAVLDGESQLYDDAAPGFYYMPWAVPFFATLSHLPNKIGYYLLSLVSTLGLIWATRDLSKSSWWAIMGALGNIWTATLIGAGQFDAISLLGVMQAFDFAQSAGGGLGAGIALLIMGMKPTNMILPGLLTLWTATRNWTRQDWLHCGGVLAIGMVVSVLISGPTWPLRYLHFMQAAPPAMEYNISVWRYPVMGYIAVVIVGTWMLLSVIRRRRVGMSEALAMNLVISPYTVVYHWALSAPALARLIDNHIITGVILWGISVIWARLPNPWPIYPLALGAVVLFIECANDYEAR